MKKAIAYVSDIILGRTGEVIRRSCQVELIAQYASDNDIDIVRWFEDEMYNEDVLGRPGIQALLSYNNPYDFILCERVWAFSRSMAMLEPFFQELDRRGATLVAATTMWDCVSQKCRHRFHSHGKAAEPPKAIVVFEQPLKVRVARPSHMHFEHVVR